jgi:hypothetical protein
VIFTRGVALPGEHVLPLPNRKRALRSRWGIGVMRADGMCRLEDNIIRPEVCAMICAAFRLPFNDKVRARRIDLIRRSRYCPKLDTLVAPYKGHPVAVKRLLSARLEIPAHVVEMFQRYSPTIPRHNIENFTLDSDTETR